MSTLSCLSRIGRGVFSGSVITLMLAVLLTASLMAIAWLYVWTAYELWIIWRDQRNKKASEWKS